MKVSKPIIENIETASEVYERAIETNKNQEDVVDDLKNDLHKYMSSEKGRRVIKGEDLLEVFIDNFDQNVDRNKFSNHLDSAVKGLDFDKTYKVHELGQLIDELDSNIEKNRKRFLINLGKLESFRWHIEDDYEPGSEHLPDSWTPSKVYVGSGKNRSAADIDLFQSTLLENNLTQTSVSEHLESLEETIGYLEELIDHRQETINQNTVEANELFYETIDDFNFPILDGLVRSLRTAKNEKQGLEHFLIHNDEHDYLQHRWKNILENDLIGSNWEVYGEEVDYFEDEPFTDKERLLCSDEAEFKRDGEFDLLLKNGSDEFAYIEIKSFDGHAEESSSKQLDRIDDYESLLIQRNGTYERINTDNFRKFWANQKPRFEIDYAEQIEEASDDINRLEGSGQVRNL